MAKQGNLNDQDVYKQGIYAREELSTTGIGEGIAIPHAQSEAVNAPGLAAMVVKDGVDYQSLDNQPAKLFFMIAVPKTGGNEHLQILAMLSQMLMDTDFKDSLINAQSVEEFMDLINQKEAAQKAKAEEKEEAQKEFTGTYRLLAVTACSTGIAHTYMAAEALSGNAPIYHADHVSTTVESESDESVGRQIYKHLMNGVSHMLPFVIGGGILIALAFLFDDYTIDPSNFGKNTPLAAFFKTTGDTAFGFMLPILAGYISMSISDRPGLAVGFVGGALASQGNSGFLGALVAGFAAGYLMKGLRKLFDYLPDAFEGLKPVLLYPFFGLLLMALLMTFIINPPVAAINTALTNALNSMGGSSKVILGMLLGGMMAVDMGGPINKAAYVFGTASIASGNYDIMAAVMIGGMVPPLAIALATFFFKNRFTKKEQQTTLTNVIMGLHLLLKEQFHLQPLIHYISYLHVSLVQQLLVLYQCSLTVH